MAETADFARSLPFVLRFLALADLEALALVGREVREIGEQEWRLRVLSTFGEPRYAAAQWRKCYKLRGHLQQKVVGHVTARVYLMNARGETTFFPVPRGATMMCSRERAVVYNRCKRMFDLSLRINRSIQEISALIGMVSVEEARGLLNEHINLMASVASLRGSLNFESELFEIFPAPVLLDTNALLRASFAFPEPAFLDSSLLMMQVWVSIDGLIFRPLSPPSTIRATSAEPRPRLPLLLDQERDTDQGSNQDQEEQEESLIDAELEQTEATAAAAAAAVETTATLTEGKDYASVKLHELSGMTINIDDNTLRYKLQQDEICVNALVSNTYLLYLFNPLNFRPLDWTYDAVLQVGDTQYALPVQREGVFLNTTSYALRVFLSYGKLPEKPTAAASTFTENSIGSDSEGMERSEAAPNSSTNSGGARGAEDSDPLEILCNPESEMFAFHLTATNRVSRQTRVVASKASCFSLLPSVTKPTVDKALDDDLAEDPNDDEVSSIASEVSESSENGALERHVHLPFDAMICYCFSPALRLQYVEFAIGFEPLMDLLGVSAFLPGPAVAGRGAHRPPE